MPQETGGKGAWGGGGRACGVGSDGTKGAASTRSRGVAARSAGALCARPSPCSWRVGGYGEEDEERGGRWEVRMYRSRKSRSSRGEA